MKDTTKIACDAKYPAEVEWISFEKIKSWTYPLIKGFAYDEISDSEIANALSKQKKN